MLPVMTLHNITAARLELDRLSQTYEIYAIMFWALLLEFLEIVQIKLNAGLMLIASLRFTVVSIFFSSFILRGNS